MSRPPRKFNRCRRTSIGPYFTEGARDLWARMGGASHAVSAALCGIRASTFNGILYGDRAPTIQQTARIRKAFGVRLDLWTTPAAEEFVPPGAEAQSAQAPKVA